jgi:hypothetical protein
LYKNAQKNTQKYLVVSAETSTFALAFEKQATAEVADGQERR